MEAEAEELLGKIAELKAQAAEARACAIIEPGIAYDIRRHISDDILPVWTWKPGGLTLAPHAQVADAGFVKDRVEDATMQQQHDAKAADQALCEAVRTSDFALFSDATSKSRTWQQPTISPLRCVAITTREDNRAEADH